MGGDNLNMTLLRFAFILLTVALLPLVAPTADWCSSEKPDGSSGTPDCENDGTAMCVYKLNTDKTKDDFKKITYECKTADVGVCKVAEVSATAEAAKDQADICCTKPKNGNEQVKIDAKCLKMIEECLSVTAAKKKNADCEPPKHDGENVCCIVPKENLNPATECTTKTPAKGKDNSGKDNSGKTNGSTRWYLP